MAGGALRGVALLALGAALGGCAAQGAGGPETAGAAVAAVPAADPHFPEAPTGAAATAAGAPASGAVADWTTRFGVVAPGQGRKMSLEEFLAAQKAAGAGGPVPIPPAVVADGSSPAPAPVAAIPVFAAPVDVRPTEDPDAAPLPEQAAAAPAPAAAAQAPAQDAPEPDLATRFLAALGLTAEGASEGASEAETETGPPLGVPLPADNAAAAQAEEAEEAARKALADLPAGEAARRGRELLDRGRPEAAERMFRHALVEEGPTEAALVGLGSAWRQMGRRRQAEVLLSRAVAAWPASPSARNSHGAALYDLGRFEEAEGEFRVAAELLGRTGRPIPQELSRNIAMAARARGAEPAPIAPPAPLGVVAAAARQSGAAAVARRRGDPVPDPAVAVAPAAAVPSLPVADVPARAPASGVPTQADPALSAPPPARPAAPAAAPSA
ncbi:MAG: hypothetical protein VYD87_21730 [Pseudomonadota bacterium]|nr:hypothetical protein [Pseudomonadota bacterium]